MRVNPADKVASLSVYTGVSSLSTSVSPGDNTGQLVAAHEWSTGITLARVLASLVKTSTDHRVSNGASTIGISAVIIRNNRYANLLQNTGKTSTLAGGSPSSDSAHSSFIVFFISRWKADSSNMRSIGGRSLKLKQTDVIGDIPVIIVLV